MGNKSIKLRQVGELASFIPDSNSVTRLHDHDLMIKGGEISAIGIDLPAADVEIDCRGKLVTPGFVDCHTHPVFANGRQEEFAQRLAGASYEEIAAAGGGISSSINGVRSTDKEELIRLTAKRLDRFLHLGTTTIEAKSGYGLELDSELKSLEVLGELNASHPIDICPTFLGAHDFPPEFTVERGAYVDLICDEMIPAVSRQGIARFCDVFCEEGYFTVEQARRILSTARKYGMIPRLHADEFLDSGAAALAAEVGAVSADHLMAVSPEGIAALAATGVIATLLPGTTFFLGKDTYAPARVLLDCGIRVALATDFNPGSCHIQSMPFIISLACIYLGMSVEDALTASTYRAAESLQLENQVGSLEPGKQADIIIWDLESLLEIPYNVTDIPIINVFKKGHPIFGLD